MRYASLILLLCAAVPALADGPDDNRRESVRRIPKAGIAVPPDRVEVLKHGLETLGAQIKRLENSDDARVQSLVPDVVIFHKAVLDALTYNEFFDEKEFDKAVELLLAGAGRAASLLAGKAPWTAERGLVVRGYRSKIDGSVQPYGLVIPSTYTFDDPTRFRLDIWFHGRGETLSEVNFLHERMNRPGEFTPDDTIVLHPYGRYCNAFKFAGEVDVYEALDSVRARYKADDDRTSVRGFSMGGAAAWHFAVHNPTRWFAANPGAGFSETPRFLDVFQNEKLDPPWYEKTLWNLYDCDKWAGNLRMLPTVAYSGEIDKQKQAADVMAEAVARYGMGLTHVIGPKTAHAFHPDARREVDARLRQIAHQVVPGLPREVHFTTYTLRYSKAAWLTVDGLDEHWKPAEVFARIQPDGSISIWTQNVSELSLHFGPGEAPLPTKDTPVSFDDLKAEVRVVINGAPIDNRARMGSDRSYHLTVHREGPQAWIAGPVPSGGLRKRHGLQGPIDDAFLDSFLIVRPTGTSANATLATWSKAEMDRAIAHWRRHFRGDARVKDDAAITDDDIANHNLVLWGDPSSNAVLARIADKLPIAWNAQTIQAGEQSFDAAHHALIAVYPNPLNPQRYVVLNSGFTFREYDYLNNARQTPKLPDWAVVDLDTPPDARAPGKVVAADFFDEAWMLKPPHAAE